MYSFACCVKRKAQNVKRDACYVSPPLPRSPAPPLSRRSSPWPGLRLRQRLAAHLVQPGLDHVQPAQVGLQVHHRLVEQEDLGQFCLRVGLAALSHQGVQVLIERDPLGLDHLARVGLAGRQAEHELEVELVALMFALDARREPGGEFGAAGRGEGVDALLRPGVLLHRRLLDQAGLFQPGQGGINLGRLYFPVRGLTHQGLERRAQIVAVAWALGQRAARGLQRRSTGYELYLMGLAPRYPARSAPGGRPPAQRQRPGLLPGRPGGPAWCAPRQR